MRFFLHTLNTWFLSLFILATSLFGIDFFWGNPECFFYIGLSEYLMLLFFGCLIALPSFFISWGLLSLVINSFHTSKDKFFLWYLTVIASVIINAVFAMGFMHADVAFPDGLIFFWPAYLAAFVVISIRYKQFFNLIHKTQDNGNI